MELKLNQSRLKIKDQFKTRADSFDGSARWVADKGLLDIHNKIAGVSRGELILELCCGTGVVGERLLFSGAKVIGLDISLSMLEKAAARLSSCVNGQAEHLPFSDNLFDILICRQAFHFLDTKQVMQEMSRVVKKGTGRIIISQIVPFGEKDSDWLYQIHRKKQPLLRNFLREQDLKNLLKESGCLDITSRDYYVEEPINNWLKDTYFSQEKIDDIKKMFLNAPLEYRTLHRTKVIDNDVFDTMRWVIIKGRKQ